MKKEILIGFIIGIIANISGSYLYIYFFSENNLENTLKMSQEQGITGSLIALGAVFNLLVFFVFLKKKQYYRARGVVLATVFAALIILITKFY
jgi:hypothetical protein